MSKPELTFKLAPVQLSRRAEFFLLLLLFKRWLPLLVQAEYSNKRLHQNAVQRCQGSGGLAPSNYFNPVPGTVSYPPEHPDLGVKYDELFDFNLQDGESAWVAGFASYSLPVVFENCVVWTENTASEGNGASIYSCLNYCGYDTSTTDAYIGVNSRHCVCFTRHMVEANRTRCDPANDIMLGVYAVKTERVKDKFLYQCNNMQINTSIEKCTEKHKSVCYTRNPEVCTNNNRHYLINNSWTFYCIVAETKTWFDSVNHCKTISGNILPTVTPQLVSEINARVNDTVDYWVGTFRSFTVADDRTGNSPCLVVTRVNNELVLEPEDCNKRRKYVCLENVRRKHGNNNDTVDDNVYNRTDILDDKNKIHTNSLVIGIVIGVGAILALFGIIFLFLSIRKFCNKTQTPFITDYTQESHELDAVDGNQQYDAIRGSYVQPRSVPLDGKRRSQSDHGNDITTLGKAEYDEDGSPIRLHNDPRLDLNEDFYSNSNLNEELYSNSQIGRDHVSDGYDKCSASQCRKSGASLNIYGNL
ncbi:uncharacterized protein LOC128235648 [Mya arenaria]|uniref:uncharacterized protein LOC128235648 n=1 Tax=Mya arenaria TaxID=6604 RepID=UPI0022DFF70A|nr:uncharacterized protein LOC128235648 [Mya arenaria]